MGHQLEPQDDRLHATGSERNWNESRYIDFYDPRLRLGGWFRLGNRVNEGHAEVSAVLYLPDGRLACRFTRPAITQSLDQAGGLHFHIVRPFEHATVHFADEMSLLPDSASLLDPKRALGESPRAPCDIRLDMHGQGLRSTLGFDQDHITQIYVPGQNHFHFQNLVRVSGTVRVGDETYAFEGRGARDQSWGPRNWHAKRWLRWLTGAVDDRFGFMLTRTVSWDQQLHKRGGFVWEDGRFHVVDGLEIRTVRTPLQFQDTVDVVARSGERSWHIRGEALSHVPLRHRRKEPDGTESLLRNVKSPMRWTLENGTAAWGFTEHQDLMVDGVPAGAPE